MIACITYQATLGIWRPSRCRGWHSIAIITALICFQRAFGNLNVILWLKSLQMGNRCEPIILQILVQVNHKAAVFARVLSQPAAHHLLKKCFAARRPSKNHAIHTRDVCPLRKHAAVHQDRQLLPAEPIDCHAAHSYVRASAHTDSRYASRQKCTGDVINSFNVLRKYLKYESKTSWVR